jgi:hypothetical protein
MERVVERVSDVTKRQVMRVAVSLATGAAGYVISFSAIGLSVGPSVFIAVLVAAWTWVLAGLIGRRLFRPVRPEPPYGQAVPRQRPAPPTETTRPRSAVDSVNPFGPRR